MGYDQAIDLAMARLAQIPPETVCEACGARYEGGDFILPWFNTERSLSAAPEANKVVWLHYLTARGAKKQSGSLIAYREVAPALFYESNFYKRAVNPLIRCFGENPQKLVETGEALGGQAAAHGDAAVSINVLPYLPMTFIIWQGCEEFPSDGNILFDKTAKTWFVAEDLAVFAGLAVNELIDASKKPAR